MFGGEDGAIRAPRAGAPPLRARARRRRRRRRRAAARRAGRGRGRGRRRRRRRRRGRDRRRGGRGGPAAAAPRRRRAGRRGVRRGRVRAHLPRRGRRPAAGGAWWWDDARVELVVELATGGGVGGRLACARARGARSRPTRPSFRAGPRALADGEGLATRAREAAHARLDAVARVLAAVEARGGSRRASAARARAAAGRAARAAGRGGARAARAVERGSRRRDASLWCVWNWVNVVAEQLASLEDPHGVLAAALLPDASLGAGDVDAKEMLKAEVVHFICKTAREFAVRRTRQADPRDQRPRRPRLRPGRGALQRDVAAPAVRQRRRARLLAHGARRGVLPVQAREREVRRVIDGVVAPRGATRAELQRAAAARGSQWSVTPSWEIDERVTVAKLADAGGYQREAVAVTVRKRRAHARPPARARSGRRRSGCTCGCRRTTT